MKDQGHVSLSTLLGSFFARPYDRKAIAIGSNGAGSITLRLS
jgi:hypothetical protein